MDKEKTANLVGGLGCGIAIIGILMIMGLIIYLVFSFDWIGGVIVTAAFLILIGIAICNMVSDCFMDDNCRDDWN